MSGDSSRARAFAARTSPWLLASLCSGRPDLAEDLPGERGEVRGVGRGDPAVEGDLQRERAQLGSTIASFVHRHCGEQNTEALEALDKAIALNPRAIEAYDLKAERLAEMGRFDEAKAAVIKTPDFKDTDTDDGAKAADGTG